MATFQGRPAPGVPYDARWWDPERRHYYYRVPDEYLTAQEPETTMPTRPATGWSLESLARLSPDDLASILEAHETSSALRREVGGQHADTLPRGEGELTNPEYEAAIAMAVRKGVEAQEANVSEINSMVQEYGAGRVWASLKLGELERAEAKASARFTERRTALEAEATGVSTDVDHGNLSDWLSAPITGE